MVTVVVFLTFAITAVACAVNLVVQRHPISGAVSLIGVMGSLAVLYLLLGGADVGQNALIRFYTLHVAILPLVITLVISLHLWRVRKDGGLAANDTDK